MSSNIFLTIAIVTTGIFAVQFILSIFFGDIDADADIDTDISSVVSFKGLTHFGIGFGWYMYLQHNTEIQTYLTGVAIGLIFVFAVWFLYKKAYQLSGSPKSYRTALIKPYFGSQLSSSMNMRYPVSAHRTTLAANAASATAPPEKR